MEIVSLVFALLNWQPRRQRRRRGLSLRHSRPSLTPWSCTKARAARSPSTILSSAGWQKPAPRSKCAAAAIRPARCSRPTSQRSGCASERARPGVPCGVEWSEKTQTTPSMRPCRCINPTRLKSGNGSIATAAGKSSGCWNTGRCTIATCGRWATRNASEGYVLPKNARPNSARLNEIVG